MIEYSPTPGNYITTFYDVIRRMEGFVAVVYDDRADDHNPTVGDGIILAVDGNLALVLDRSDVTASRDEHKYL